MVTLPRPPRSHCPINFGLELFGDAWTLLILRDVLVHGKRTFGAFRASEEGIASNILADRLHRLEAAGLLDRQADPADGRQFRYEPTEAGRALLPVLVEMSYWGATHDPMTAAPPGFVQAYEADRAGLLRFMAAGGNPAAGEIPPGPKLGD